MDRGQLRDFYCFLHDGQNGYYSASYDALGKPIVSINYYPNQKPINDNPANIKSVQLTFGTNKTYFAGTRSVAVNWEFVGDGANIVRYVKYNGAGYSAELYILIIRYNPSLGYYESYYEGRLDFSKAKDNPITGYSVPCIDLSCWGVLSQNDSVKYQIDCTSQNPVAIPILFDGITLQARFTYQAIEAEARLTLPDSYYFPIVVINTDGDSSGVVTSNQTISQVPSDHSLWVTFCYMQNNNSTVTISGTLDIFMKTVRSDDSFSGSMQLVFMNMLGDGTILVNSNIFISPTNTRYTYNINQTVNLDIGEKMFMALIFLQNGAINKRDIILNPVEANITITTKTSVPASIVYGLRPLDVLQAIVSKATNNKYTANSNYFTLNNRLVLTCGNALRNAPNAYIVTSFQDFFKSYDTERWLAFRIINNEIWIEPAEIVYDDSSNLFELGEVTNLDVEDAYEHLLNQIKVGSPPQDYRHTSGRLEFNTTNSFSVYQFNIKNSLSLESRFRKDSYGMEFIRLDYQEQSTKDNTGDDSVFMVDITDQKGSTGAEVENFVSFDIDSTPLAPLIYYPFNNDTITNDKPIIRGACEPSTAFNVYVDGSLDGSGSSDSNGYFAYNIQTSLTPYVQNVSTGVHTIDLTFTDETGTLSSVTVNIFTGTTQPIIDYPKTGDNIYNNKPIVKGFLQTGTTLPFLLNGVIIGSVTGDGNCRWNFQSPILDNKQNIFMAGDAPSIFTVNSFTAIPLITKYALPYDAIDGFTSVETTPLIEGVANAGTKINLYLDYYPDVAVGTTFADAKGNWSIQLVPMFQSDNVTQLVPIPNGNHILSTDLEILSTKIAVNGFMLNRPAYDNISGVIDNSVYNTQLTPMHNILNRMNYWKSIFYQQPDTVIKFETGDKNQSFSTTLNGITTKENNNVVISQYTGTPLFLPYTINFTTETPFSFVESIDNFNQGGLVQFTYQGQELFALPIGKMTCDDVTRTVQKWSLLVSAKTSLITLLNLSNQGQTFTQMANSVYHSDYNTLHFVKYGYQASTQLDEQADLYEDWFVNRNSKWIDQPEYLQKVQRADVIIDQIIVNSVTGTVSLDMFNCATGAFVQTFSYVPVTPAPIPSPDIVQQCTINFNQIPDGEYFFALLVGGVPCAISERITVQDRWYGTIFIDSGNSVNKTGAIFSNGWRSQFRIEGHVEKYVGGVESIINEDEIGNFDVLHAISTRKRTVLFGKGTGIPDYLYLRIVKAILLDDLKIQGVGYTITKDSKIEPVNKIPGYPMYYYAVDFDLKDNSNGFAFDAGQGNFRNNVILVVDAGAFGVGGSQLSEIELD